MFTNSTRIIDLTVGELESILQKYTTTVAQIQDTPSEIVRGLKAIASVLGISEKTLSRWRREKIITAPTIRQICGVIIADKKDLLNFKKFKK